MALPWPLKTFKLGCRPIYGRLMHPSRVLKIYYASSFAAGVLLTFFLTHWVATKDVGPRGAAIITACLNVLLIMLLPLVLDWAESKYFKARFIMLEEVAKTNPELASILQEQCQRLAIPNLRLAIVQSSSKELFSYGLWRNNPRLVLSESFLEIEQVNRMIPSIEAELIRFSNQDMPLIFLMFGIVQEMLLLVLLVTHVVT
jgi:Zn-dependent protease with chaperone function